MLIYNNTKTNRKYPIPTSNNYEKISNPQINQATPNKGEKILKKQNKIKTKKLKWSLFRYKQMLIKIIKIIMVQLLTYSLTQENALT